MGKQHLKLLNVRALEARRDTLRHLRIEDMKASRPEDVREILEGIPDPAAFNMQVQRLLFDRLIPQWMNLDAIDQMTIIGRIARWQIAVNQRPRQEGGQAS